MDESIKKALEDIRPALARHAGDVEFVRFENGTVFVRFLGLCVGGPLSTLTLKAGIEEILKSKISEVKAVEAIAE